MDWIERLTGLELDGGTGTLEWALFLVPLTAAALVWWKWRQSARNRRP
ncbi:MAG: hypothetical protein IT363_12045 [Methanoregulaceae archaeon]|jgi:hypothetical protein|nr:hypothetical protein [Methanoregulaceae archaeon]